jgi:GDP-4-dehydro-6-deoxy-D-mannose reductase
MKVLVTGADGFVGRHLVRRLLRDGHEVGAAVRPGVPEVAEWTGVAVTRLQLELADETSIRSALAYQADAVVHLAAVASNREAWTDPGRAWVVNAAGTARLAEELARRKESGAGDPLLLVISSGEVYGPGGPQARLESDPPEPQSPYAASKLGAEVAALEVWRRTGLRVILARPFTHTGPGQPSRFALPAFVERLRAARAQGRREVLTGNLDPVRDLLDVRDVVEAYLALMLRGRAGETYNVSRGEGLSLRELFRRLAELVGVNAEPTPDPSLARAHDLPHLVGDSTKLRGATGWAPVISIDAMLRGLLDAQAD